MLKHADWSIMKNKEFLESIIGERPVGSEANSKILDIIQAEAEQIGMEVISLPFECKIWDKGKSFIISGNESYEIFASPFSRQYRGYGEIEVIHSIEELNRIDINDKIVFLQDNISKEQLQPKDFPFYYPEEHKRIIDLLEGKNPKALIAVTGKHPMCGLEPFPLFEDGNFSIPSAYISVLSANKILQEKGIVNLCIDSDNIKVKSRQIIATRRAKRQAIGKIIVCAHMDTKYGTPGAIDNASGVAVLLSVMKNFKNYNGIYDMDFVPFNGEEYYEAKGELEYLIKIKDDYGQIKLVINIDSPCHRNSKIAVSSYNLDENLSTMLKMEMEKNSNVVIGEEWYAGDHAMLVFNKIPCLAVTSSDLFETVLDIIHTEKDTIDRISEDLIDQTVDFLSRLIDSIAESAENQ